MSKDCPIEITVNVIDHSDLLPAGKFKRGTYPRSICTKPQPSGFFDQLREYLVDQSLENVSSKTFKFKIDGVEHALVWRYQDNHSGWVHPLPEDMERKTT